ncbi:hypothetical protein [Schleiferilactobacillus perolens]|uniref:Uncharacterized protein n=1 Tax=Schleiferilactobacillus perolens DSM 12744 TaxID=1423792 RepID=A0A0R1MUX2_9LACO|nr:hypothetical protein [Schleiferilactobacillus perolens]KRL11903.1 hypothetical protein FD09_GL000511 [Schleiferilactobacillus perolens DSM 12744]
MAGNRINQSAKNSENVVQQNGEFNFNNSTMNFNFEETILTPSDVYKLLMLTINSSLTRSGKLVNTVPAGFKDKLIYNHVV